MRDEELLAYHRLDRHRDVKVTANDYSYGGTLATVFRKRTGAIRAVVEDDNGRLFIHNPSQIEAA